MSTATAQKEPAFVTGFAVLVTSAAMAALQDREKATDASRTLECVRRYSEGTDLDEPMTHLVWDTPFCVHVDPARRQIFLLTTFPGWPIVTDEMKDELVHMCEEMKIA